MDGSSDLTSAQRNILQLGFVFVVVVVFLFLFLLCATASYLMQERALFSPASCCCIFSPLVTIFCGRGA